MKLYKIYFSPTGGTKKCIDLLSRAWNCEKKDINLLDKEAMKENYVFSEEDVCIIAVPSFGGRVPAPALEQIGKMSGQKAKTILMAVYGNRDYDDTLLELREAAEGAGFCSCAAVAAVAEHSIMHQYGTGRPDSEDEKELIQFAEKIREQVEKTKNIRKDDTRAAEYVLNVPGNRPYREYNGVPFQPKADKRCNKCGICAKSCPTDAILPENPSSLNKDKCISCLHCIAVCPHHARSLNPLLLAVGTKKMKKECSGRKENHLYL